MHRRKNIALTAGALGVLAASAIAWGVNHEPGSSAEADDSDRFHRWGHRHGGPMAHMAKRLDLSEEQQLSIAAILNESRNEAELLRAQLEELRRSVGDSIRAGEYDEDEVRILVENQAPAFVDMTMLGIRTMSQVYEQLTPEQRDQADEMMEKRRSRRFGRGFGMPGI